MIDQVGQSNISNDQFMRSQLFPNTTFSQCSPWLGDAFVTRDLLGTF